MPFDRRDFLATLGLGAVGTLAGLACAETGRGATPDRRATERERDLAADGGRPAPGVDRREADAGTSADELRSLFRLDPGYIHLAGLLLASQPRPVRRAVAEHRRALDRNPAIYLDERNDELEAEVRRAAADYLRTGPGSVALTESTTMGLALAYNGVRIREDQEFLVTENDYYSTRASIRYRARRSGAGVRTISLYRDSVSATREEIARSVLEAVRPETRVVALTWVHSDTGLRIPVRRIADGLAEINRGRGARERALLCLDGVHGLGVRATGVEELGCDLFTAGTHKWLLGPPGTGILWADREIWSEVDPTIPTFTEGTSWGARMTRGGFKSFEQLWALAVAFEFHRQLGPDRVERHIHRLCRRFKEGVAGMDHVTLHTPMAEEVSAGIVCFEVRGRSAEETVEALRDRQVVASRTPYVPSYARVAPGILNTSDEIETTLRAIEDLA